MKFSTLLLFSALTVAAAVDYDAAYIHLGCSLDDGFFPEYATNDDCQNDHGSDCVYGDAWYCNDGIDVGDVHNIDLDNSAIHSDCETGVHFSFSDNTWYCKDDGPEGPVDWNAFIVPGCVDPNFPQYATNDNCQNDHGEDCVFGEGWYCTDGTDVSNFDYTFDFDNSFIYSNCNDCDPNQNGKCVYWRDDLNAWVCNDSTL